MLPPTVPITFVENSGSATAAANILNILGTGGIVTSGSGNTVTIALSGVGPAIETLSGNTGTATPVSNNIQIKTANTTVTFVGSTGQILEDFGLSNLLIGSTGSTITSGVNNVGLGLGALTAITSGQENVASGVNCLSHLTQGSSNCGYGVATLASLTTSNSNTCYGNNAGQLITTGAGGNTSIGYQSLSQVLTGSFNTSLGYQSGRAYTSSESNNITIGNGVLGTAGETAVTRIGNGQTACFISGIDGVNVGSVARVVTEASNQLGTAILTAGTGIMITPTANTITITATGGGSGVSTVTAGTNINLTGTASNPIINLNDPVRQQNDSQTSPSYSFVNETGTGMFLNTDLRLGLTQAGTRFMLSDASNTNFFSQIVANAKTFLVGVVNAYNSPGAYPYTVDNTLDYYIPVNSSASAHTINFPNTTNTGHTWVVKDSSGNAGTNNITLTTPGGTVLFDGSTTFVIDTNYGSAMLIFNGTNYEVF